MEKLNKTFSENLNYYLALRGKSRSDLARALNVTTSTASDWCSGHLAAEEWTPGMEAEAEAQIKKAPEVRGDMHGTAALVFFPGVDGRGSIRKEVL